MWNPNVEHAENVAGFVRKGHGDFSIGEVNTTLLVRDNHPLLILTDGSPCPSAEHLRASTAVRFICDTSVFGSGNPQFVAQLPPDDASACAFFVEWRTHYACPSGEPSGFWGGLIIGISMIAIALLMLYLTIGTLYRRNVLQMRGFDQLPRISFFSFTDALEWFHHCFDRFAGARARPWQSGDHGDSSSAHGRGWRRGFSRLPSLPEEEEEAIMGVDNDDHGRHSLPDQAARLPESGGQGGESESTTPAKGLDTNGVIRL